jgi:hypothetical protein
MNVNDIVAPVVNLNGTSKNELLAQLFVACDAVENARKALGQMTPNGRDYQTAPAGTFDKAIVQHLERVKALETVLHDLEVISLKIDEQK